MKLLFTSDLQLRAESPYDSGRHSRLQDNLLALERIRHLVHDEGVSTLVIAGDVFQHRRPGVDELVAFGKWIDALPCEVLLVAGNHDVRGPFPLATTLDIFGDRVEGCFVTPTVRILHAFDEYPDVALGILPWAHPGALRAHVQGATPQEQAEALERIAADLLVKITTEAPLAMPVLVTHYALDGMSLPTGLAVRELIGEPVLDTQGLFEQGWRYVFAGHVHAPGHVETAGREAFSIGPPWRHDFGEASIEPGVVILDSARDAAVRVPVPDRDFVTVAVDGSQPIRFDTEVVGSVVRVGIRCTEVGAAQLDVDAIRRRLYEIGADKVYAVSLDVERKVRARAEGMAEDSEPLASLEAWSRVTGLDDHRHERLRELTRELLEVTR